MQKKELRHVGVFDLENMCCGCTACESVCPVDAIAIVQNGKGFYIPEIDDTRCVSCGLCQEVCQINKDRTPGEPLGVYAALHLSDEVRMNASSGGLFPAITAVLSEQYGDRFHCFGAAWNEKMELVHMEAGNLAECGKFAGSKYVQSSLTGVFPRIEQILRSGEFVLFAGTGCQCAGLRSFIAKKRLDDTNLLTVDLICHGVPSPGLWKTYLQALEAECGQKIVGYQFRDKTVAWHGLHPKAALADGTILKDGKLLRSYGRLFGNLSLNEPCYHCKYANTNRVGDLTLGDYWGVEQTDYSQYADKGVSLCMVNTEKGAALLEALDKCVQAKPVLDASYLQPQLKNPTRKNVMCGDFWKDYRSRGYLFVANKYTGHGRVYRMLMKLRTVIRNKISKSPTGAASRQRGDVL